MTKLDSPITWGTLIVAVLAIAVTAWMCFVSYEQVSSGVKAPLYHGVWLLISSLVGAFKILAWTADYLGYCFDVAVSQSTPERKEPT
jgi:hypothetical protein